MSKSDVKSSASASLLEVKSYPNGNSGKIQTNNIVALVEEIQEEFQNENGDLIAVPLTKIYFKANSDIGYVTVFEQIKKVYEKLPKEVRNDLVYAKRFDIDFGEIDGYVARSKVYSFEVIKNDFNDEQMNKKTDNEIIVSFKENSSPEEKVHFDDRSLILQLL